jgi:NAD(P)-dependent dehydrogenase (short-subunit alcohol dehydrogenase family)
VVNISAPQAMLPMALQAHVCTAKAGVDMLTRVLAIEWGNDGIRVNSVIPGPIENTEGMTRLAPNAEAVQKVVHGVPLGRLGTRQDVADLILFLASPHATYITGAVIPVDGGWSANGAAGLASTIRN